MQDVLAQVAANTDMPHITGNTVLYKCILTVITIESEADLRNLAINILEQFVLSNNHIISSNNKNLKLLCTMIILLKVI